ncbi:hypothetical protein B0H14DRAFT_3742133 [Mycena olivaceomarginata]|nr:hypothetical protein B0H14DRAFT_3742133 [Mycena olivaceomarginata]
MAGIFTVHFSTEKTKLKMQVWRPTKLDYGDVQPVMILDENRADLGSSSELDLPGPSVAVRLLSQIQSNTGPHLDNYLATDTGGVDWGHADYDARLEEPQEIRMTTQLAQNLVDYLRDSDLDDSDDDLEERSQIDNSSASDHACGTLLMLWATHDI